FVKAAELCARLASEGESDTAMTLARCLFTIDETAELVRRISRDERWYVDGLQKVIPALTPTRTEIFLKMLLDGLRSLAESKSPGSADSEYDSSPWWRPAIEEHEQNSDYEFASKYVGCVREAFEIAIRDNHMDLRDALRLLDSYPRLIFKRFRVHLINEFADDHPELATKMILDNVLFDDHRFKHEYAMLCGRRFTLLTEEEKVAWLAWIDAGPDMSDFNESFIANVGRQPTAEDQNDRIEYWKYEKLHWIRDYLKGDRLDFYQSMLAEHGEPGLADLNVRMHPMRSGSESPFSVDYLEGKDFKDVIERISAWRPDKQKPFGPSTDGVAATFKEYLAKAPEKYIEKAEIMKSSHALYVRTFLEAMTDAITQLQSSDIGPLLDLCKWGLDRPLGETTSFSSDPDSIEDKDWQWTRDSISRLVRQACASEVSLKYRADLWDIVSPLTNDSGQSYIVDTSDDDPRTKDYTTLSLNSPCGQAMHAVFAYARWIANGIAEKVDGKDVVKGGFDKMPEVRDILESKLAPDDPGGFSLRATYGWFWSLIYWIDRDWLAKHADRICDLRTIETAPEKAYGWAAWNTFLVGTNPHKEHYRLLRDQFSYAIDQASEITSENDDIDRPFDKLGVHLVIMYGQGHLDLDADNAIVRRLLTKTTPAIRTHAMEFIGNSLRRTKERETPGAVRDRLITLWDWYWKAIGEADAHNNPTSGVFGYWFVSGVFDDLWALERLKQFVQVVPKPEPNTDILERLAEIASVDLQRSVSILGFIIAGDDDGWIIYNGGKHTKKILASALTAETAVRERAMSIIDQLGRRGFVDFGELLKQ
ncbi:MAG: hypothetical protein J3T61_07810, partial [Candidatus Brocadiales bacterium]|nr:hypothetical protein [Candidatus Bathyanammoxibius sp.]